MATGETAKALPGEALESRLARWVGAGGNGMNQDLWEELLGNRELKNKKPHGATQAAFWW